MTGHNGNGKDIHGKEKETNSNFTERRAKGRLTDAEANRLIDGVFKQVKLWLGDKLLKGFGWLLFSWALLAITEAASGGKVSLGAAIRFLMTL